MSLNKICKSVCVIIIGTCIAVSLYFTFFFFIPRLRLSAVLSEFEEAARGKDYHKLHSVFSKKSPLYELLESKNLQGSFTKFENGITIRSARLIPYSKLGGNRYNLIWGYAKMIAKEDGEERFFDDIVMVKEKGGWKILQFSFPDLVDY